MNHSEESDLFDFVTNGVNLGFTFLETARLSRDSGHNDHAIRALLAAQKACDTGELFSGCLSPGHAASFKEKLNQLRAALHSFETP